MEEVLGVGHKEVLVLPLLVSQQHPGVVAAEGLQRPRQVRVVRQVVSDVAAEEPVRAGVLAAFPFYLFLLLAAAAAFTPATGIAATGTVAAAADTRALRRVGFTRLRTSRSDRGRRRVGGGWWAV